MILTVQSVRSVGIGMLIEQISFGANFMLIGPQENVSLRLHKDLREQLSSARTWSVNIIRCSQEIFGPLEMPENHSFKSCPHMRF